MTRKKIVVSDSAPLIQLDEADRLELLPLLYEVTIPQAVFEESQYYNEFPDAINIARATGDWLRVKKIRNKKEMLVLLKQKLGRGESEAIILCQELRADSLLTSDKYAASKATSLGIGTITIADVIRDAYRLKIMTASQCTSLLKTLVLQNILNTSYIRELLKETTAWP